ncbi:CAP domain-containing protein [Kitasatospora cathayae]|uniref:CAP domain-containing protein n=1 Tax=Kitasatospora cathayae TaxID=3004092 RepID=A0ABY7QDA1_9ACTN|nr:CAP domain-containing protein [Kitasatospora sp. HUAS 3-15]WBP90661.1 CAP domain-containing protein [Kitasatospora sp. HUAS 3-15]
MSSDDRTTISPVSGGGNGGQGRPGGRAARRAAERHQGRGRRGRRRGGFVPVTAVVAAVAGTGLLAALAGAGYAAYDGKQTDRDLAGQAAAADSLVAAELGTHEGIQVPGAGGTNPSGAALPSGSPTASGPAATPSATAGATASASPTALPTATATATAQSTATAKASPPATRTGTGGGSGANGAAVAAQRAAAAPAAAPAGGGANASYAQQVVDLVNVERAKAGCGPVSAEPRLASAAQSHSDDMADRNYFDHASPEGYHADHRIEATGYRWNSWGENIARGQKDPAAVMDAWMNSPGHRANILNCDFKQLGVGVRTGANGPWWTQVFAAPA